MSDTLFQKASDLKAKPEEGNSLKSRLVSLLSQSPSHDQRMFVTIIMLLPGEPVD